MVSTSCLFLIITVIRIILVLLLTAIVLVVVVGIWSDVFVFLTFILVAFPFAFVIVNTRTTLILLRITLVGLPIGEKLLLEIEYPWMLENLYQRDSLLGDLHEELVNQVFVLLGKLLLELDFLTDLISGNCRLVASEWCVSVDEFIQKDTKCPDVEHMIVLSVIDHFWRHILQCSTKSVSLTFIHLSIWVLFHLTFASPAEVTNFEQVILVDQKILRL